MLSGTKGYYSNLKDDVSLSLIQKNTGSGKESLVAESDLRGNDSEDIFAILNKGDYILRVKHRQDLDGNKQATQFELGFDTKTFKETSIVPNDPMLSRQWHLLNTGQFGGIPGSDINAVQAWKNRTDAKDVIVAIIDGGIDLSHPDLDDNIWENRKEIPGNNLDDDNNEYVDDYNGWNFVANSHIPNIDAHGTHVAGIVGAEGNNNIGVSGVAWDIQLMSLDIFDTNKKYKDEHLIEAINYAVENGADIINMSLGYTIPYGTIDLFKRIKPDTYQLYLDTFTHAINNGVTLIASAGNDDAEDDLHLSLPAAFSSELDGFISVAAVDQSQFITDYSNYGGEITLAAPGGSSDSKASMMFSTLPESNQSYGGMPGTSMAAPVVAGTAALILSENKKLKPRDIEEILTSTASKEIWLQGFVQDGNLLNVDKAIKKAKKFNPRHHGDQLTIPSEEGQAILKGSTNADLFDFSNFIEYGDKNHDRIKNFSPKQGDSLLFLSLIHI